MKVLIMKISRWFKAWRKPAMHKAFNRFVREVAFTNNIQVKNTDNYFSFDVDIHARTGFVNGQVSIITNRVQIDIPLEKETIAVLKELQRRNGNEIY